MSLSVAETVYRAGVTMRRTGDLVLGWLNSPQKEKLNPSPFSIYYEPSPHERYVRQLLEADHLLLPKGYSMPKTSMDIHFWRVNSKGCKSYGALLGLEDENKIALESYIFYHDVGFWMDA